MPKEDLLKLAEALEALGYKIISLLWRDSLLESPYEETVDLRISKGQPKDKTLQ